MSFLTKLFKNLLNSKEQAEQAENTNSRISSPIKHLAHRSYTVDFACEYNKEFKDAVIVFGDSKPGTFLFNGIEKCIIGNYVDDGEMSSDYKYRRIFAGQFSFWVKPSDFSALFKDFKGTLKSWRDTPYKKPVSFESYLGSEMTYKEVELHFNASGVSHDYGIPAKDLISKLKNGDLIQMVLCEDSTRTEERVALLTKEGYQIGWMPLLDISSQFADELLKQMEAGIIFYAKVEDTGLVRDKPYRWCKLVSTIKIPYSKQEEIVYIAPSGYLYHRKNTCNSHITEEIPLSWALQRNMKPCKKCCKEDLESTKS